MKQTDLRFPISDELNDFEKRIMQIYECLYDSTSRAIFENRLMYCLTNDYGFMRDVISTCDAGRVFYKKFIEHKDRGVYLYGAGIKGGRICQLYPELEWAGFIDLNKKGSYYGLPVFTPQEIVGKQDVIVLISNRSGSGIIRDSLCQEGFLKENIYILDEFNHLSEKDIYFDEEVVSKEEYPYGKGFVDVGCFDGKDSIRFLEWVGEDTPVYAFEADEENYRKCQAALKKFDSITLYKLALSNKTGIKSFNGCGAVNAKFSDEGDDIIKVAPLDRVLEGKRIGYIKMDIEGAEEEALEGAKTILAEQCPILALSLYHRRSDIWKLPEKILSINERYRLYIRHYTAEVCDTVLYAVCSNDE